MSLDHTKLVLLLNNNILEILDIETFSNQLEFQFILENVNHIIVDLNNYLVCFSQDQSINIWDLKSNNNIMKKTAHRHNITALKLLENSNKLISASKDNTIKIWDLKSKILLHQLDGHSAGVNTIAIDDMHIYSGSDDYDIKIWNLQTGNLIHTLEKHESPILSIISFEDYIVSYSKEKIYIWDVNLKDIIGEIDTFQKKIDNLSINFNEKQLFGTSENLLYCWDLKKMELESIVEFEKRIIFLFIVNRGRYIIIGTENNIIERYESDQLISKHKINQEEKSLFNLTPPFEAYNGDNDYIFVSYAHKDLNLVFPIINDIYKKGFNLWYDEGIQLTLDYEDFIIEKLINSKLILVFVSLNSIESEGVNNEIELAIQKHKTILPIYLEKTELPNRWIFKKFHLIQGLMKFEMNQKIFKKKILDQIKIIM
ncbi:MAG: TIR domain-containing protein [Candidatus Lokiarchaeota archaeon]|nr:TIR domain-containing protein [Candidatus Lokiarchaeota archaeon]